uniref:Tyrosine-protein phosphatase domain-containing protein n=1 Tax=Meloidogyne hapla TaxID=6305 RepID=A0A1I8BPY1_MELHA
MHVSASYQLQIEFPDFRPTVQHLKMLSLLPQDGNSLEEITLGSSLDWIFVIRRPSGTTQKFRWEEVRELVANKRKLSIKCGENLVTSVFYFCNYVSTVLSWKWRHARTDALQQRSARLSVQNLQGALPSFSQAPGSFTRRSNTNVNAVRPNSEMIVGSEFTAGATPFLPPQPSTPQLTIRTDQNSQSTVNSIQSCNPIRPPLTNCKKTNCLYIIMILAALSASRSISIGQILPPSNDFISGGTNSSALPFIRTPITNVIDKVSPPVAGTCSANTSSASTFYVPAVPLQFPAVQQQQTSNGSQEDWLRHEQHEVLKRMLTERRRLNKIGSSPEINTLGKSVSAASGAKCKKHQIGGNSALNANSSVADVNNFSLARKIFTSTPDLHSARLNQQQFQNFQVLQQQQPQSQPQTPLLPPPKLNGSGGNRIIPGQTSLSSIVYPPPTTTSHHNINPDVGGNINTSFYLQNSPIALRSGPFSQGQIIDENGQQQTIIYPIPPDASSYVQPPPSTSIMEQILQQSPQLGHVSALQIPPQLAVQGYPPTTNSPPSPAANHFHQQEESRRSSPKSNATSSHSELQPTNNGVNNSVDQTKALPEFAEIEFSGIPAKSLSADYSVAVRSHNLIRNRGSKIYPYNENRLKLAVTNSNPDGYINASEVIVPIGRNIHLRYVISQAPIQKTIEDFWQMVWQTGARLIGFAF